MTSLSVPCMLGAKVRETIPEAKVLVVGAGGIGCEILKSLALSGFKHIEVIDLDTIDVSNLNRQFLFRKEHIGKSKAEVARESILNFNPNISIKAYHDSITTTTYGVNFFKEFKVVLNALDNRVARNHVNRMCLAANVPLIESGTAGYNGQVEFIMKGLTQCYECQPKAPTKTYPGCTIRNTPSEPVHCVVWAKHLFNQLFGENDPDQDVSPDTSDPELGDTSAMKNVIPSDGNVLRLSTRLWAQDSGYDAAKLFNKFFERDILYLLTMGNLWNNRDPPMPLTWMKVTVAVDSSASESAIDDAGTPDMRVWSLKKCAEVFAETIDVLKKRLEKKGFLVWDKDDPVGLDFVTACTNIRAHIFNIHRSSRFSIKSIAGNIIPAIATTNAIIAGLAVLMAFKALAGDFENCKSVYIRNKSVFSNTVLAPLNVLEKPNPKCYVCAPQPYVYVYLNVDSMTVKEFETLVLKDNLNMIAPDVMLDGKGILVISSEEGDTEVNNDKKLSQVGIVNGSILRVDDFVQNYCLTVEINQYVAVAKDDPVFKVVADLDELKAAENGQQNGAVNKTETNTTGESSSKQTEEKNNKMEVDGEDDLEVVDEVIGEVDDPQEGTSSKRRKLNPLDGDDEVVMLDDP